MSQFNLTPEEDALVLGALRSSATRYTAMYGVADPALEAVIAKAESQLPQPEVVADPVAEEAPVVEEVPAPTPEEE
jgi:hypothetical protein